MTDERRDIGSRLENWATWATASGARWANSQTGSVCERMRREVEGLAATSMERRRIDEGDALRIERGLRELAAGHRNLLWWCYITRAQPEVVCRKMGIPHRPASEFVERFRQAQAAIEAIVDENERMEG